MEMQNEELRKAKEIADLATQKYTELYDFAPSGYFALSLDGDIEDVNLYGSQMLGKERKLLIGCRLSLFLSEDTRPQFNNLISKVFHLGVKETCDVIFGEEDSTPLYVQLTCNITFNRERFLLNAIDITERKLAEEEVKLSRLMMKSSLESQKGAIILSVDREYRYLFFNSAHASLMKDAYDVVIEPGMSLLYCIKSERGRIGAKEFVDMTLAGESHSRVWKLNEHDQNFYESFYNPIVGEDLTIIGASIFSRNITERKRIEELIHESKVRLDKTQEIAHLGSWELDLQSGQIFWSDEVYRIFGFQPQEFAPNYRTFLESTHPGDRQAVDLAYRNSLAANKPGYEIEHRIILKNSGELRFVFEKCEHIKDASGEIIRSVGMVQDITEKKLAEETLKESEQKFRSVVQSSSELIFSFNPDETYRFVNNAYGRVMGIDPDEFIGKTRHEIFHSEEVESGSAVIQEVFRTGERRDREATVRIPSGEVKYFLTTVDPVKNDDGEVIYVTCVSKDITTLKQSEQAFRESQEIFQSFMEHSPIYVFFKDRNLRSLHLSRNFETMTGKPLAELYGKSMNEVFPSEFASNLVLNDRACLESGLVLTTEEELKGRSYSTIRFPIKIEGKSQYLAGYTIDITERKKAEQAFKESEAQVKALLAAIPDMIFVLDSNGVFIDYHGPLTVELYTQPEEFLGRKMYDVLPPDIAQMFNQAFANVLKTGEVQLCEYSMELSDGLNYYEAKVAGLAESKFLTTIRNVSGYKRAEAIIKQKNVDLERINGEKDKFFSIISHDLRGPFSGFLGITETLAKRLPDMTLKEIQEITFLMRNSAIHLFRLIGNLLEWSKMQRGMSPFAPKSFFLKKKIDETLHLAEQLSFEKEITISCNLPDDLKVFADENMLESIIRNLLSNAVKYTSRHGKVYVSATLLPDESVRISVRDTGIGMNQKLIEELFRIDIKSNRKGTEGEYSSGLGLIICKDFIDRHCGKFEIKSKEGKGTTFSFTLPGYHSFAEQQI